MFGNSEICPVNISSLPQEDLIDVLRFCPLATKCRVRRVSRYWKHVVGLPEANITVIIDAYCLHVTTSNPYQIRTSQAAKKIHPLDYQPSPLDSIQTSSPVRYFCKDYFSHYRYINFTDHQRHGLMGPHVRTLIYDGSLDKGRWYTSASSIQTIGSYCTDVKHVVLWRRNAMTRYQLRKKDFKLSNDRTDLSQMAVPETFTVVDSVMILAEFPYLNSGGGWVIPGTIKRWTDMGESGEEVCERFLECSSALRQWVAKYAPSLSEDYHLWLKEGLSIRWPSSQGFRCLLTHADYGRLDGRIIRFLARCILNTLSPDVDPVPQKLEDHAV